MTVRKVCVDYYSPYAQRARREIVQRRYDLSEEAVEIVGKHRLGATVFSITLLYRLTSRS